MENIPFFVLLLMGYGPPHWSFPWWLWAGAVAVFLFGTPARVVVKVANRT